jgi:hypothetical protein
VGQGGLLYLNQARAERECNQNHQVTRVAQTYSSALTALEPRDVAMKFKRYKFRTYRRKYNIDIIWNY